MQILVFKPFYTEIITYEDGRTEKVKPDGSKTIISEDGKTITVHKKAPEGVNFKNGGNDEAVLTCSH